MENFLSLSLSLFLLLISQTALFFHTCALPLFLHGPVGGGGCVEVLGATDEDEAVWLCHRGLFHYILTEGGDGERMKERRREREKECLIHHWKGGLTQQKTECGARLFGG